MMLRTQISLDPESHRRAKEHASRMGISLSEYFRRLVDIDLGEQGTTADATSFFDLGNSGGSDVANHKDEYISAALSVRSDNATTR